MKLSYVKNLFVGLVFSLTSVIANANLITLSDSQEQTITGQDFNFQFGITDWAIGTEAELYVEVQGDLGYHSETLNIIFDGLDLGTFGGFNNGYGEWEQLATPEGNAFKVGNSFTINATSMQALVFDSVLSIDVNLSKYVHEHIGDINNVAPYVLINFSYEKTNFFPATASITPVTEPSTIAILGLALMGLGARRFKK